MHPYLRVCTLAERLQRLHASTLPRRYTFSAAPKPQSFMPPCLHVLYASRTPPVLHTSASTRLQPASRTPYLYVSTLPHLWRPSQSDIPPYLHDDTPAARLQYSIPPYLQRASRPPRVCTSILPHLQAYSAPPVLQTSRPRCLHVCTPAERFQSYIILRLHTL